MSDEIIKKVEKIIQDYGIEDGKPSEEVLSEMQKAIQKHKLNITPQEFAILEGRLKMRNTIIKDMQSAIEEAEKHIQPAPDTKLFMKKTDRDIQEIRNDIREIKNHIKKEDDAHKDMLEQIQKGKESYIKISEHLVSQDVILRNIEEQTKETHGRVKKSEDNIVSLEKNDIRTEISIKGIENTLLDVKKYFEEKRKKEEERSENWANGWKSLFFDLLKYISIGLISGIPTAVTAVIYLINVVK